MRSLSTTLAVARSKAIENLHFRRHLEIFDHCRCYSAERRPKEEIAPLSISSNSFGGAKRMVMEIREELPQTLRSSETNTLSVKTGLQRSARLVAWRSKTCPGRRRRFVSVA